MRTAHFMTKKLGGGGEIPCTETQVTERIFKLTLNQDFSDSLNSLNFCFISGKLQCFEMGPL